MRRLRILVAGGGSGVPVASVLSALLLTALTAPPSSAQTAAVKTIGYHGYRFTVPASWPVVDLAQHPRTCVRFDRHAVYLGTPGADQDCPSRVLGRTDALLVEPGSAAAAATARQNSVEHQITATAPGVSVTAAYASSPTRVAGILTAAGFPTPTSTREVTHGATGIAAGDASVTAAATLPSGATTFTGLAFEPCDAPSSAAMNAWKASSPYGAIGLYIGGANRGCPNSNLTASWVSAQAAAGWHFFLLYVGLQDPDVDPSCVNCQTFSAATSRSDAASAARDAAAEAGALGFGGTVPIIYDMEQYSSAGTSAAISFIDSWTTGLHGLGYASGEYSSASSGITDLVSNLGSYTPPDVISIADWNGQATAADPAVPSGDWANHQRIHQYSGDVSETYGGDQLNIDKDYMDVATGSASAPPPVADRPSATVIDPLTHLPDYFVLSNNSGVYQDGQTSSGWTGFSQVPGSDTGFVSAPAAVAYNGKVEVFAVSNNGSVYQNTRNATTWTGWERASLFTGTGNNGFLGTPAVALDPSTGLPVIFVRSNNTGIYQDTLTPTGWSGFAPLPAGTDNYGFTFDPAAVAYGTNKITVLAVSNNGSVYQNTKTGPSWSGWDKASLFTGTGNYGFLGTPAAVLDPATSLPMFAVRSDNTGIYRDTLTPTGWSGFAALPAGTGNYGFTDDPNAVAYANSVDIYAISNNGSAYHNLKTGSTWTGWDKAALYIGSGNYGFLGVPAAATNPATNLPELFTLSNNTSAYLDTATPTGWTGFGSATLGTGNYGFITQ